MQHIFLQRLALAGTMVAVSACSDSNTDGGLNVPPEFRFQSTFDSTAGQDSVNYTGQICRHVLIAALKNAVQDQARISGVEFQSGSATVPYFDDTIAGAVAAENTNTILAIDAATPVLEDQDTLGELCGSKHLKSKFAGNDTTTDFKDWNTLFEGVVGQTSAEAYLRQLLDEVSHQAQDGTQAAGQAHYISSEGIDYAELIQKFLLGAVPFAQGADDYLDNDASTPNKGLLTEYVQSGGNPYASLEHAFDEGYGYFGAARAYNARDDQGNRTGVVDDNGDNRIDLVSEHNFGASTIAAKRDQGAAPATPTNFTGDAFAALRIGRAIISSQARKFADMDASTQAALVAERDKALAAWEGAIAATVVHYINDVLDDMEDIGTTNFDFAGLAKHYSEMKGFALGLQFSPHSPLHQALNAGAAQTRFQRLHVLLRDRPVVSSNDQAYRADLLAARSLLGEVYGFSQENLEAW